MARRRRDRGRAPGPAGPPAGADRRRRRDARREETRPTEPAARPIADQPARDEARRAAEPSEPNPRTIGRSPRQDARRETTEPIEPPTAVGPGRPHGRRWLTWAAAAAIAGVLLYTGGTQARRAVYAARLPVLPELSRQPPALREHLEAADRRDRPHVRPTRWEHSASPTMRTCSSTTPTAPTRWQKRRAATLGAGRTTARWRWARAADTEGLTAGNAPGRRRRPRLRPRLVAARGGGVQGGALRPRRRSVAPRSGAGGADPDGGARGSGGARSGRPGVRVRGARAPPAWRSCRTTRRAQRACWRR